ncbi:NAD(P)H-binding protein [Pseudoxanthomonas sp. LARHCG66]
MLVAGGRGVIGRRLVNALRVRGHEVVLATRDGSGNGVVLDFAHMPSQVELVRALTGIDVVINAVGIFRASGKQSFDALHVKSPACLLEAARAAGVFRFVQVSALGADTASSIAYLASKGEMDARVLASSSPAGIVVRPSLVFDPRGASTRWFAMLAVLPVTPLPGGGQQRLQPVHVEDLAKAVVRLVEAGSAGMCVDAVGPRALRLRDYIQHFKRSLNAGSLFVTVPGWLARVAAGVAGWLPRAPFHRDALRMLEHGNVAAADTMVQWRGGALRDPADFTTGASDLRTTAWLGWLLPIMRITLAAMWIATALVSLWGYPREASLALLVRTGLQGEWATAALWTAALLDLVLGLAILRPRWRTPSYLFQGLVVVAYTLIISLWLPEQWLHPYGPVLKNLPVLAMIACLWALDRGHGPDPR